MLVCVSARHSLLSPAHLEQFPYHHKRSNCHWRENVLQLEIMNAWNTLPLKVRLARYNSKSWHDEPASNTELILNCYYVALLTDFGVIKLIVFVFLFFWRMATNLVTTKTAPHSNLIWLLDVTFSKSLNMTNWTLKWSTVLCVIKQSECPRFPSPLGHLLAYCCYCYIINLMNNMSCKFVSHLYFQYLVQPRGWKGQWADLTIFICTFHLMPCLGSKERGGAVCQNLLLFDVMQPQQVGRSSRSPAAAAAAAAAVLCLPWTKAELTFSSEKNTVWAKQNILWTVLLLIPVWSSPSWSPRVFRLTYKKPPILINIR